MSDKQFKVDWWDRRKEPQCQPDPNYPNGKDVDASDGAAQTCTVELPYPAKRCGVYVVHCQRCGLRLGVTTAGRPDDPRTLKLACKETGPEEGTAVH